MTKSNNSLNELTRLEVLLDYNFQNQALLEQSLTHRSWAHEQVGPGEETQARRLHNEALEFVGDSVLGLTVAAYLFETFPDLTEGELSRMKHQLVSAPTLRRAAERLTLGQFARVGRGEEKTGGRRKQALLADIFEPKNGNQESRVASDADRVLQVPLQLRR